MLTLQFNHLVGFQLLVYLKTKDLFTENVRRGQVGGATKSITHSLQSSIIITSRPDPGRSRNLV